MTKPSAFAGSRMSGRTSSWRTSESSSPKLRFSASERTWIEKLPCSSTFPDASLMNAIASAVMPSVIMSAFSFLSSSCAMSASAPALKYGPCSRLFRQC